LDLASEMPHSDTFFYDMVHFNDAGAELVGKKVAVRTTIATCTALV